MEEKTKKEEIKENRNKLITLISDLENTLISVNFDDTIKQDFLNKLTNLRILARSYVEIVRLAEIVAFYKNDPFNDVKYKEILKKELVKMLY